MNEVLQAAVDYVNTPGTDYALLVTGPWGCGKTFFWKHRIVPELRKMKPTNSARRILYASLYGVSDPKEIDRSLFAQSYPVLNRKSVGRLSRLAAGALEALGYVDLAKVDLRSLVKANDAVICFDDLERARLPMEQALGYINTFVEHEQAKVIILCNEDAISDQEARGVYVKMKEKVVGASLGFRPDLDSVFTTLVDEYKHRVSFHAFLSADLSLLRRLFEGSATSNIRSLRRAISALAVVFDLLKSNAIAVDDLAKPLIYAVAPTAFELHGRGATADDLRRIHGYQYLASISFATALRRTQDRDGDEYQRNFAERYLPDGTVIGEALGCLPICEFLLTGILNRPALLEWARELTRPPDEKEERIKRLTTDPWEMEDDEFATAVTQVLKEVEAGDVAAIGSYIGLFSTFEQLAMLKLVQLDPAELLAKFSRGLRNAEQSKALTPNPELARGLDHPSFAPRTEEGRTLRKQVKETNERLLTGLLSERIGAITSRLEKEPLAFIDAISESGEAGVRYAPVFDQLLPERVATWIIGLPNKTKMCFLRALRTRYGDGVPRDLYAIELACLAATRDTLRKHCEANSKFEGATSISLLLIGECVKVLDGIVAQLRQQDAPANASLAAGDGSEAAVVDDGDARQGTVAHAPR